MGTAKSNTSGASQPINISCSHKHGLNAPSLHLLANPRTHHGHTNMDSMPPLHVPANPRTHHGHTC
eukprot:1377431-Amorphochlora_amoeboformis.AAC.1